MVAFTTTVEADFSGTALGAAPTWTDITRFARLKASPATINSWRTDELSTVAPSSLTMVLDNAALTGDATAPNAGRFTPGNSSSPYAAGLTSLFRIRVSVTVNGTTYRRFDGYADPLDANWLDGEFGVCNVGAADWLGLAGNMPLKSMLQETVLLAAPALYLPLTDASGSASPAMLAAPNGVTARMRQSKYGGGAFAFAAAAGPVAEGLQVLTLTPTSSTQGYVVEASGPLASGSIAFRVNWTGTATSCTLAQIQSSGGNLITLSVNAGGRPVLAAAVGFGASCGGNLMPAINDGKPHDLVCLVAGGISGGFAGAVTLYLDGVQIDTGSPSIGFLNLLGINWTRFQVGGSVADTGVSGLAAGTFSHAALWGTTAVSNILAQYQAGATGFAGERIDLHIARLLSFRPNNGLAGDVAEGFIGLHQIAGVSLQQALLDSAKAEGGVLFVDPNNAAKVTLFSRARLRNPSIAATLDITAQQTTQDVNIREDTQQLFNDVTISRPGGGAQRVVDAASQAGPLGVRATSDTYVVNSDLDALNAAGWLVGNRKTPTPKVPQLVHDALTEPQATVATTQAVLALAPLKRVTLANRPADFSVTDVTIQGRTDTIGVDVFMVAFSTGQMPRTTLRFDAAADAFTKLDSGLVFAW
jgi:hypothetical protein